MTLRRRDFLKNSAWGALCLGTSLPSLATPLFHYRSLKDLGPLLAANEFGMRVPEGFRGRLLAQANKKVKNWQGQDLDYKWHILPDGGACFKTADAGWIYTSNSEVPLGAGGAGAIRFDSLGRVVDAYSILKGTSTNCSGGPTPWGTWLSCEETATGAVFECDVTGRTKALKRKGLGNFKHEAVAIDSDRLQAYLTEDLPDGRFYRYTPSSIDSLGRMNLDEGVLEVAIVSDSQFVSWVKLENPNPGLFDKPTREQIKESTAFTGGEGIWYHQGLVHFTTKGDNRVWTYEVATQTLRILYDKANQADPILSGVDALVVSKDGHILVAEDGDDMQIVILGPYGDIYPLVQIIDQSGSEITGPAISPLSNRLYFSSQRGKLLGLTYELEGQFA